MNANENLKLAFGMSPRPPLPPPPKFTRKFVWGPYLLTCALVVLRLLEAITWSWWLVLLPAYIMPALTLGGILSITLSWCIGWVFRRIES